MADWTQTAFLFPGQGSQLVGMGADAAAAFPAARRTFEEANDLLGLDFAAICWEGPEAVLNDTLNTQPALYITSIALVNALKHDLGTPLAPAYVAGHSLGELTALTAAGALPFSDGLALVRERGRVMKAAGEQNPGAMAAILGLPTDAVHAICQQASSATGGTLVLANDNCPGQVVISGDVDTVTHGVALASAAGARRSVPLAVSIASHSPLMAPAQAVFASAVDAAQLQPPSIPVIGNVNAAPLTDIPAIRYELQAQLTSPVRWTESMEYLLAQGITRFVEVGSGDVLSGLMKRINRQAARLTLSSAESLQEFAQEFSR